MSTMIAEEAVQTIQRGLSDWWTEETEYVFQRIERWAAFARGYNRLRSQRYSRGRLTMTEEPVEPGWNISANKLVVEDCASWNPRFHNLQRSRRRKNKPEEARINCCGTFNYQSNNNLDNQCLERYRYDHSIYFKTIGDIRGEDRNRRSSSKQPESPEEFDSETKEQDYFKWNTKTIGEIECHRCDYIDFHNPDIYNEFPEDFVGNNASRKEHEDRSKSRNMSSQIWPIVDLAQLNVTSDERIRTADRMQCRDHTIVQITENEEASHQRNDVNGSSKNRNGTCSDNDDDDDKDNCNDTESWKALNAIIGNVYTNRGANCDDKVNKEITGADDNIATSRKTENRYKSARESKKSISIRKTKQSLREVYQPTITGENNIVWPGVLLNYKKNVDPVHSPHSHSIKK